MLNLYQPGETVNHLVVRQSMRGGQAGGEREGERSPSRHSDPLRSSQASWGIGSPVS